MARVAGAHASGECVTPRCPNPGSGRSGSGMRAPMGRAIGRRRCVIGDTRVRAGEVGVREYRADLALPNRTRAVLVVT